MDKQTLEILELIASFLTPLILLVFGILLNKKLEISKSTIAKKKTWQELWAKKFLNVAYDYDNSVTECIVTLFQIKQISDEKISGWEKDLKQKKDSARFNIRELQCLDWKIQNFIQFASKKGTAVKNKQKQLFHLLETLISTKQGDLEEIRRVQFEFNNSVRLAHAEMLELPPNQ